MRRGPALLVLAALAAAGCAEPAGPDAAPAVGRIDGAVLGPLLQPYGNATVLLEDLGWTTTTTPLGGFSFLQVPAGLHVLSAAVPGTSGDRAPLEVAPGKVARVILQVTPFPAAVPYVASLRSHGEEELAMPGRECAACAWTTRVPEHPDLARLEAAWEGTAADGRVVVELWNGPALVGSLEVPGDGAPRATQVPRELLPGAGGELRVTARFTEDFLPTVDFRMESLLHLHYHTLP